MKTHWLVSLTLAYISFCSFILFVSFVLLVLSPFIIRCPSFFMVSSFNQTFPLANPTPPNRRVQTKMMTDITTGGRVVTTSRGCNLQLGQEYFCYHGPRFSVYHDKQYARLFSASPGAATALGSLEEGRAGKQTSFPGSSLVCLRPGLPGRQVEGSPNGCSVCLPEELNLVMVAYNGLVPVTHGLCHCNPKPVTVTYAPFTTGPKQKRQDTRNKKHSKEKQKARSQKQ